MNCQRAYLFVGTDLHQRLRYTRVASLGLMVMLWKRFSM